MVSRQLLHKNCIPTLSDPTVFSPLATHPQPYNLRTMLITIQQVK